MEGFGITHNSGNRIFELMADGREDIVLLFINKTELSGVFPFLFVAVMELFNQIFKHDGDLQKFAEVLGLENGSVVFSGYFIEVSGDLEDIITGFFRDVIGNNEGNND